MHARSGAIPILLPGNLTKLKLTTRTIAVTGKATDLNAVRDAMAVPESSTSAVAALRTVSVEYKLDSEEFFANVIAAVQPARS